MRVADRPLPTVVTHPLPPGVPIRPVIAVEPRPITLTWDDPLLVWDDPALTWDYVQSVQPWADLFCDYQGLSIESGHPDEHGIMSPSRLAVTVDNRSGRWSQYNADGSLVEYGPGRHVAVWADDGGSSTWWLFYGRVARWDERADDLIEIEAFDLQSDLAQHVGSFTPGAAGDRPGPRLSAIAGAAGFGDRTRFDTGTVTLTQQVTEQAPLEEMQHVAQSDGGVVWSDADGTIVFTARTWRAGRSDQTVFPVASDNVCTAPITVWAAVLSTNDMLLADRVVLDNLALLRSTATALYPIGAYVLALADLQYTTQAEGDTLAAFLLGVQNRPRLMVDGFDLHLFDPRQATLWQAVDWRLFDRLRFVHDAKTLTGVARLDLITIVISIDHDITPAGWVMSVATSRAVDYARGQLWDQSPYTWDDPGTENVWGF